MARAFRCIRPVLDELGIPFLQGGEEVNQVWKQLPYYRRIAGFIERLSFLIPLMEGGYRVLAYYRLPLSGKKRLQ